MMRRNVNLQMRLLDELMDMVTIGEHKLRLRPESVDIHRLIDLVLETCGGEISKARMEVARNLGATNSIVLGDPLKLQQILWNLLKNAVKFSPHGGLISITTADDSAGWLTITVADHGLGIEAALLPHIFDSFRQGAPGKEQRHDGLGLGLFIAKELAEAHGGMLTAFSEGRGQGASFRLTLAATAP